jgi:hypothetical protein
MPASGALGPFLEAMLRLRAQRLEEQEAKDKGLAALGEGISGGIGAIGKGIAGAMKQQKTDAIANRLLNQETPPVAGGMLPSGVYQQPGVPATGGAKEIELRKAMGQYSRSSGDDLYKQLNAQLAMEREARAARGEEIAAQQRSYQKQRNMSADARQDIKDSIAFQDSIKSSLTKMSDPTKPLTPQQHATEAENIRAVQARAEKQKIPLESFTIPPYMSEADRAALAARDVARQKLLASQGPSVNVGLGIGAPAQSREAQKFGEAQRMVEQGGLPAQMGPGGIPVTGQPPMPITIPAYTPPPQQQPAAQGQPAQQAGPYKLGQRAKWPDGSIKMWNGQTWVPAR